jgi:5-methylcytosine-specific restriction enzyme subunit McrC
VTSTMVITALEHQPIPVTEDGRGWSLTPAEAEKLAQLGELRPGFCEIGYRSVKLAQYCGIVQLGDRILEVLPKTQERTGAVEDCRGVLLRLLRLSNQFPQFQHLPVGQHLRRVPLLEAFIAAFFDAVATVTRGGLRKQYQEREDDLRIVRGRIALTRQFGVHANRLDVIACAFDELTPNNVWNQVLKKALRMTRPSIRTADLARRWVELMDVLDEVDDADLTGVEVARLVFDRQAERYRLAVEWARWILALLAPSLRAGKNEAPALLFDMNKLFESAIAGVVQRRLAPIPGVTVSAQDTSNTLVDVVTPDHRERGFPLRPDLVIRVQGSVKVVADTKWKLLGIDGRNRLTPSEVDLYQMHAYAAAFQCRNLALLYPWHDGLESAVDTEFHLPAVGGERTIVKVLCFDVHDDRVPARLGHWPE